MMTTFLNKVKRAITRGLRCSGTENRVKPLSELLLTLIP